MQRRAKLVRKRRAKLEIAKKEQSWKERRKGKMENAKKSKDGKSEGKQNCEVQRRVKLVRTKKS